MAGKDREAVKFERRDYQQEAYRFLSARKRSGLFLDMGLGKTAITLTWVKHLVWDELATDKVLVIAPKRVVEYTWPAEIEKWEHTHMVRYSVVTGTRAQREAALEKEADIYLINRENVSWLMDERYKGKSLPFDALIIDESSSFKNQKSKRWKSLKKRVFKIPRVVLLTGTPAPNGYLDLWAQVYLIDGGKRLGGSFEAYKREYFEIDPETWYSDYPKFIPRKGSEDKIREKISDICMYMDARDHVDLPAVTYNTVPVHLSTAQMRAYKEFEKKSILEFLEEGVTLAASTATSLSNKLLQYANGAVYHEVQTSDGGIRRESMEVHDEKLDALEGIIEDSNGQNILVAYMFQQDRDRIAKRFGKLVRILETRKDEQDWNAGKVRLLLMHPASGGHGLNLQHGGHIIVWFSTGWDLELYQQLNARLPRSGQKHPVVIHHLVTQGTEDERVLPALRGKGDVQQDLLNGIKLNIAKFKKNLS